MSREACCRDPLRAGLSACVKGVGEEQAPKFDPHIHQVQQLFFNLWGILMKNPITATLFVFCLTSALNVQASEDSNLLQMTTCQDSWLDWKQDPVKLENFRAGLESRFKQNGNDGSYSLIKASTVLGQKVSLVYPQSVGTGLGYSVIVEAGFDPVRKGLEKHIGKPLGQCGVADGMKSCEHKIAEKKTIVLMEGVRGKNPQTLLGCYYYYEK